MFSPRRTKYRTTPIMLPSIRKRSKISRTAPLPLRLPAAEHLGIAVADSIDAVLEHKSQAEHRGPVVIVEESRSHSIHGTRVIDTPVDIESQ